MEVLVMSREQAKRFSYKPHNQNIAIISICDPDKRPPLFHSPCFMSEHFCYFWDEEDEKYGCITEDDAEGIANFILNEDRRIDLIIVQCEAGVSRSAGVAAAILKVLTGDDTQIFDDPKYSPNMKCYRMVLNAMTEHVEKIG